MMDLGRLFEKLVERPVLMKRIGIALLVLVVLIDLMLPREYVRFPWDNIRGFGAFYGFISCVLIIIVSKWLGKFWLSRPEHYYDSKLGDPGPSEAGSDEQALSGEGVKHD